MSAIRPSWRTTRKRIFDRSAIFSRDEDGSIIVLTLILLIMMLVLGGMAVDFMRFESRRAELQSVTDRAVLAAAGLAQELPAEDVVFDYFEKAGFDRSVATPAVLTDSASERSIRVTSELDITTFYLRFIGIEQLSAPALAEAQEGVNKVEVSMVLDYSASMRTGGSTGRITEFGTQRGRIGDLQDAAAAFAASLLTPEYDGRFSLNIVPYGGHVNPGEEMFNYLNTIPKDLLYIEDTTFGSSGSGPFDLSDVVFWSDDVGGNFVGDFVYAGADGIFGRNAITGVNDDIVLEDASYETIAGPDNQLGNADDLPLASVIGLPDDIFGTDGVYGTSDDISTVGADVSTFDSSAGAREGAAKIAYRYDHQSHCNEIPAADFLDSELPSAFQSEVPVSMRYRYDNWEIEQRVRGWGWCPNDEMRIQYGMQDADKVADFFSTITTHDGTGTDIGMKWGLALLDPSARPAFTALNAANVAGREWLPDASLGRPADWDDTSTKKIIVLMTDGFITFQNRPADFNDFTNLTTRRNGVVVTDKTTTISRLMSICNQARDLDVEVYTVAFETDATAGQVMENCATDPTFYNATSGAGLTDVFEDIAEQITALRLTQ